MTVGPEAGGITVLLIEDDAGEARRLTALLAAHPSSGARASINFEVARADRIVAALQRLAQGGVDVVLLDLMLPDSRGLKALAHVQRQSPETPVVVLVDRAQEALAIQAVQRGAQDYIVKPVVDAGLIVRSLRYAMERQHLQRTLGQLSLADELTGLYNRRGFCTLCEHHLKLAPRTRGLVLVSADLEDLAEINGRFGEREGDRALLKAADILRATFRASDVIARVGEDEFAILLLDAASESVEIICSRLRQRLDAYNRREASVRGYTLALAYSVTHFAPDETPLIDELLALGDAGLVEPIRAIG